MSEGMSVGGGLGKPGGIGGGEPKVAKGVSGVGEPNQKDVGNFNATLSGDAGGQGGKINIQISEKAGGQKGPSGPFDEQTNRVRDSDITGNLKTLRVGEPESLKIGGAQESNFEGFKSLSNGIKEKLGVNASQELSFVEFKDLNADKFKNMSLEQKQELSGKAEGSDFFVKFEKENAGKGIGQLSAEETQKVMDVGRKMESEIMNKAQAAKENGYDAGSMLELQFMMTQYGALIDMVSKAAGKVTQAVQTVVKQQ